MPKPDIESGQGVVEYALILILVVIVLFVIITLLGPAILDLINEFINSVKS